MFFNKYRLLVVSVALAVSASPPKFCTRGRVAEDYADDWRRGFKALTGSADWVIK